LIFLGLRKENISIALVLLLSAASFAIRSEMLIALWGGGIVLYVMFNFHKLTMSEGRADVFLWMMLTLVTFSLPYALLNSISSAFHYFVFVMTLLASYLMRESLCCLYQSVRFVLYSFQLGIVLFVFYHGFEGFPLDNMIPGSSSNVITSLLIVLQAAFSILNYSVNRRFDIFPALITMLICIIGYGRGSLIASFLIVFVNVACFVFSSKRIFFVTILAFVLGVLAAGERLNERVMVLVNSKTKIGSGLHDSSRLEMHKDYFAKMDVITAFVGVNYDGTSIENKYNGNPHSSYIRAHHIFGVLFIFGILVSLVVLAGLNATLPVRLYVLSLSAIVLFRAATEPVLFPTALDIFYYGFIFALLYKPKGGEGKEARVC